MEEFKNSVNNMHNRNKGSDLVAEALIHNEKQRNDYIVHNESLRTVKFDKMNDYVSELRRLKNQGRGNQFAVKKLDDLIGRKKNGPRMEMYNKTLEDEKAKKGKSENNETFERHSNIREYIFAWYRSKQKFLPIEARESATWVKCENKAY